MLNDKSAKLRDGGRGPDGGGGERPFEKLETDGDNVGIGGGGGIDIDIGGVNVCPRMLLVGVKIGPGLLCCDGESCCGWDECSLK